jgi:hypothetical protein
MSAIANLLFSDPALVQKLPFDRPTPAGLPRGVELAARMTIEHAPGSVGWKSFLDAVSKDGHHGSWRRAALLALVRSEIGNELLKRASAHLFDNKAEVLRELVRLVMAVDVDPGTKRFSGLGVDPRLIPVGLNVPNGLSWSRAENRRELGKKGSLVAANWRCSPGCKINWVNRWRPGEALKRAAISIGSCFRKWRKSEGESRIRALERAVVVDWLLVSLLYTVVWK